ncbi:MAG TPA: DUF4129 domain-containing protein [Streptosporangiaceae bacterium]|nr:DUF4129 domain-containing protein [Streptosporangiaceae bacterium]
MRAAGHGETADRRPRRPGGPAARLGAAVLLLVVAALGTAARGITHLSTAGTLVASPGSVAFLAGVAAVAAACLALAGLLALLASRRRRRPEDELTGAPVPVPWWARAIALLAALALIALPIAAIVVLLHGRRSGHLAPAPVAPVVPRLPGPAPSARLADTAFLAGSATALAVLVVGALVVAALWLRRRRRAGTAREGPATAPSPLAVAVAAGTAALGATAGTREAIIACYAAMETTLAAAGAPRRAADTPEELLTRAERDGIIRTPAAGRLTALFREARFSPHRLAEAQRDAAQAALDDIGHDLAGRP